MSIAIQIINPRFIEGNFGELNKSVEIMAKTIA